MKKYVTFAIAAIAIAAIGFFFFQTETFPESHEITGFPLIEQPDQITCGPTSATMVLQCYGVWVSVDEVKNKTKTQWFKHNGKPIGMTSPEYLPVAMTHFSVKSKMTRGDLNRLKYFVSQNKPVIVLLRSGKQYWHYVVVIGYDKSNVIIADPGWGKRRVLPEEHFLGSWNFTTDMQGNPTASVCPSCKGDGRWTDSQWGPLSICPTCDGSGNIPDVLSGLLKTAEVHPHTMIVPSINTTGS